MPLIDKPFKRIAVDFIGPVAPVSENGNRYILTVVDFATRYPEAVALPKIETERVAETLLDTFSRVGFPKEILSDRGGQFTSDMIAEVCRLVSIKQLFTTAWHPMCDGLCEKNEWNIEEYAQKNVSRKTEGLGQIFACCFVCLQRSSTSKYGIFSIRTSV